MAYIITNANIGFSPLVKEYWEQISYVVVLISASVLFFFIIPKLIKAIREYNYKIKIEKLIKKYLGERNYKVENYLSEIEFQYYLQVRDVKKENEREEELRKSKY